MRSLLFLSLFIGHAVWAQQKPLSIRGTWVTNVASTALHNAQTVNETVALCKARGLNTIFVVVWNNGVTMYPSKVVESYIGIRQDTTYKGFDPIAHIVAEGHRQGLKVHAWFEFGFSYAYQNPETRWQQRYPHWAGRDSKGALLQKNGFYWWNALHPEVQTFMKNLVREVVRLYPVDGVQGDDRLPAMPSEGGYDDYTRALYLTEKQLDLPQDPKDSTFLQWKADKLSDFGKALYAAVKQQRPSCLVSWAPSIYPWAKEQYLQDWPAWLKGGYADFVMPQLYRYDIKAYETILKELHTQLTTAERKKVFPGILTSLGNGYRVKPDMLAAMIRLNRQYGFSGECLFYFETLRERLQLY
jgi:uncharacterized lipoprotein YddW (UPF0748 family)